MHAGDALLAVDYKLLSKRKKTKIDTGI